MTKRYSDIVGSCHDKLIDRPCGQMKIIRAKKIPELITIPPGKVFLGSVDYVFS